MLSIQEKTSQVDNGGLRDVVQRRNASLARTVDRGIELQQTVSTMCAMEYLYSEGVPHLISRRVLSQPTKRRTCFEDGN